MTAKDIYLAIEIISRRAEIISPASSKAKRNRRDR